MTTLAQTLLRITLDNPDLSMKKAYVTVFDSIAYGQIIARL